jgi:hypothetical protein
MEGVKKGEYKSAFTLAQGMGAHLWLLCRCLLWNLAAQLLLYIPQLEIKNSLTTFKKSNKCTM